MCLDFLMICVILQIAIVQFPNPRALYTNIILQLICLLISFSGVVLTKMKIRGIQGFCHVTAMFDFNRQY